MIARNTLYSSPGGDTVQIVSTAKYLRLLGVEVDIKLTSDAMNYEAYSLIHFFNIIRPDDILPHLKKSKLPYVVSTIFVDYSEYEKRNRAGITMLLTRFLNGDQLEYLKTIARFVKNGNKINSWFYIKNGHAASIEYVGNNAAMLLPNSNSEYKRFVSAYRVGTPYMKVTNAIDKSIFSNNVQPNKNFIDHVLCVGRIEGRKNQLNLIRALANTNVFLTLIGKPSPNHISYYDECKMLVDECENMQIIDHIEQDELSEIYLAAKVHVLPSWFETTGLSTLEAAAMDCNVVITKKGDTTEYFSKFAYYCDPENIMSIRDAVLKAHEAPTNPMLKELIFREYIWENAAHQTYVAYNKVLFE
jgi:glycosyltransferase involved in cell wall biosynthesis